MYDELEVPVTVLGMRVKYLDKGTEIVSNIDMPFRAILTDLQKDFGDPNNLEILDVRSNKMYYTINYNDLRLSGTLKKVDVNKTKTQTARL